MSVGFTVEDTQSMLEKGYVLEKQADILYGKEEILSKIEAFPSVQIGFMEDKKLLMKTASAISTASNPVYTARAVFPMIGANMQRPAAVCCSTGVCTFLIKSCSSRRG